jgi:hypothetical protein
MDGSERLCAHATTCRHATHFHTQVIESARRANTLGWASLPQGRLPACLHARLPACLLATHPVHILHIIQLDEHLSHVEWTTSNTREPVRARLSHSHPRGQNVSSFVRLCNDRNGVRAFTPHTPLDVAPRVTVQSCTRSCQRTSTINRHMCKRVHHGEPHKVPHVFARVRVDRAE